MHFFIKQSIIWKSQICQCLLHILIFNLDQGNYLPSKLKVTTAKHSIKTISIWQLLACVPFVTLGILIQERCYCDFHVYLLVPLLHTVWFRPFISHYHTYVFMLEFWSSSSPLAFVFFMKKWTAKIIEHCAGAKGVFKRRRCLIFGPKMHLYMRQACLTFAFMDFP